MSRKDVVLGVVIGVTALLALKKRCIRCGGSYVIGHEKHWCSEYCFVADINEYEQRQLEEGNGVPMKVVCREDANIDGLVFHFCNHQMKVTTEKDFFSSKNPEWIPVGLDDPRIVIETEPEDEE